MTGPVADRRASTLARFLAKVRIQSDGCLVWTAAVTRDGYGNFYADGRMERAHRWYFEQVCGPVPDGLVLDHLCRVRACVNPDHLRPVTRRENTLAPGSESNSARRARQSACKRGHQFIPTNVHGCAVRKGVRRCRACSNATVRANNAFAREGATWSETDIQEYADWKYATYLAEFGEAS